MVELMLLEGDVPSPDSIRRQWTTLLESAELNG